MSESALLRQLLTTCKRVFQIPLPINAFKSRQQWLQELRLKDVLTLSEAACYLDIDPGTLLEEVGLGKLPGGKLGGQWYFHKWTLAEHFAIYHLNSLDEADASPEDISIICDPSQVKELLEAYETGERNFAGIDLRGASMSNLNLPEIDLVESLLMQIDLRGSNLQAAELQGAKLQKANLSGADLSHANLQGANLSQADLSKAVLLGANLKEVNLMGTNLSSTLLQDAIF